MKRQTATTLFLAALIASPLGFQAEARGGGAGKSAGQGSSWSRNYSGERQAPRLQKNLQSRQQGVSRQVDTGKAGDHVPDRDRLQTRDRIDRDPAQDPTQNPDRLRLRDPDSHFESASGAAQ